MTQTTRGGVFRNDQQTATTSGWIALAWMTGLFVSPEALLLQGNLTGLVGFLFVALLMAAIVLHGVNVSVFHRSEAHDPDGWGEIRLLKEAYGSYWATFLLFAARPALSLCLATAVLVSAGFVFNEIFLNWFPNFGFAALLLAIVLTLNLASPRTVAAAQVLFTATAVIGLAGMAIFGLAARDAAPIEASRDLSWVTASRGLGLAAIAFVGYDMLCYTNRRFDAARLKRIVKVGLGAGGLLFILWNAACLWHVAPSRLAQTSIPHLLAAKAIMDATGRIVMGVVVIAGACAAVNYLFHALARAMAAMACHRLLPVVVGRSPERPVLALLILAGGTGLLMAVGFAGSHWLDVGIRASFILWLLFYALRHMAGFRRQRPARAAESRLASAGRLFLQVFAAVAMTAIALLLLIVDDDPRALLTCLGAILLLAAAFSGSGLLMARGGFSDPPAVPSDPKRGEYP